MTQAIAMHRSMDMLVFDCFVRQKIQDPNSLLKMISKFRLDNAGKFNEKFFSIEYCSKYALSQLEKFKASSGKRIGFKKCSTFEESIIEFFIKKNSKSCFLPQIAISEVLGVSQKTVSVSLKSMVENGLLILEKRGSSFTGKASVYSLAGSALNTFLERTGCKKVIEQVKEKFDMAKDIFKEKALSFMDKPAYKQRKEARESCTEDRPFRGTGPSEDEFMEIRSNSLAVLESLGYDVSAYKSSVSNFKPTVKPVETEDLDDIPF